ncbi:MAG: hypothetical protein LJE61_08540 [Thiocapsa sp.]|nr:hypothetical protein [Thiocapsa sp.]MCG6897424.1 hypothetical protein [Thiocapsa sp.]MCG6985229.1 hypothetical protein [Thiocapsa sp.]
MTPSAAGLRQTDLSGRLRGYLDPPMTASERAVAAVEGWILGVGSHTPPP